MKTPGALEIEKERPVARKLKDITYHLGGQLSECRGEALQLPQRCGFLLFRIVSYEQPFQFAIDFKQVLERVFTDIVLAQ